MTLLCLDTTLHTKSTHGEIRELSHGVSRWAARNRDIFIPSGREKRPFYHLVVGFLLIIKQSAKSVVSELFKCTLKAAFVSFSCYSKKEPLKLIDKLHN